MYEFPFVIVLTFSQGINDLDQYILENVFGEALVLYKQVDGSEDLLFVPIEENFERAFVTFEITANEFMIV